MPTNLSQNKIGAFPAQYIKKMVEGGEIINVDKNNIQPASIDLSISEEGYRMKGVFLPRKNESAREIVKEESLYKINLKDFKLSAFLYNFVYLIKFLAS